jgi:hypothetical protein
MLVTSLAAEHAPAYRQPMREAPVLAADAFRL